MNDLVSIIMPAYNCGEYIDKTIDSVLKQTYGNWELLIVDDNSNDNTKEIVHYYLEKNSKIKYFFLESNSGAAAARTKATIMSTGRYIAFLDSDDLWYPNKLEKQIIFMKSNNYAFTCTDYEQIDENGKLKNKIFKAKGKTNYNGVLLTCPIGNSTVMYDSKKIGKFTVPDIKKRNDDALWLKILKQEEYIYGLNLCLTQYRVRKNSISSNKFDLIKYHWLLYRKIEHLTIPRSVFHICFWIFIKIFRIK